MSSFMYHILKKLIKKVVNIVIKPPHTSWCEYKTRVSVHCCNVSLYVWPLQHKVLPRSQSLQPLLSFTTFWLSISTTGWTGPEPAVPSNTTDCYTMVRPTLSGVMGPVFTEIHKSSLFAEFFFFFVSDLEVAAASPQQQQQPLAWRQQQQWQHTTTAVRKTSRGSVSRTTRQIVL